MNSEMLQHANKRVQCVGKHDREHKRYKQLLCISKQDNEREECKNRKCKVAHLQRLGACTAAPAFDAIQIIRTHVCPKLQVSERMRRLYQLPHRSGRFKTSRQDGLSATAQKKDDEED